MAERQLGADSLGQPHAGVAHTARSRQCLHRVDIGSLRCLAKDGAQHIEPRPDDDVIDVEGVGHLPHVVQGARGDKAVVKGVGQHAQVVALAEEGEGVGAILAAAPREQAIVWLAAAVRVAERCEACAHAGLLAFVIGPRGPWATAEGTQAASVDIGPGERPGKHALSAVHIVL